jgi:peptide/nickel transport system permease protein
MATTFDVPVLEQGGFISERPAGLAGAWRTVWRFCRRKPLGAIGGAIVVGMLFAAVFVDLAWIGYDEPLLAPDGYNNQHIRRANIDQGPSLGHPMGTDELGRDIFSRILYGARISAIIGFSSVAIAGLVSLIVGTISGYAGGWLDTLIQRFVDIVLSIPAIILLLFALTVFAARAGPYKTMLWIIVIVGFLLAIGSVRVVRSAAIATANNQYVDAARTIGATPTRIVFRHIMPNVVPVVIVLASVQVGTAILAEATISFLGYGIPNPFPSWGAMLSLTGSSQFRAQPIQAIWPGLAIALAVYGYNMLGDALRDVLDPRLRGGR